MSLPWIAASVACFAGAVGSHAVFCRLNVELDRVIRFLIVGTAGALLLLWALLDRYNLLSAEVVAGLLVYAFACELYIFLFTMTISSISSNILVQLAHRDMQVKEVAADYDSAAMVRRRLERLKNTGFLLVDGERVSLPAKGTRLVRAFRALRAFFRHSAADA